MRLTLCENCTGRNEYAALANLVSSPESKLALVSLSINEIEDEGTDALRMGLTGNSQRTEDLNLGHTHGIAEPGWRPIFALLCRAQVEGGRNLIYTAITE